jgi:hypothetical protein
MNSMIANQYPPILSVRELICALNLTNYSLSVLEKDETFPLILIGNQRFVLRDSLLEWMKAHEQPQLRRDANGS